eukprot:18618-Heterococcus_DN1.PRE.3
MTTAAAAGARKARHSHAQLERVHRLSQLLGEQLSLAQHSHISSDSGNSSSNYQRHSSAGYSEHRRRSSTLTKTAIVAVQEEAPEVQ